MGSFTLPNIDISFPSHEVTCDSTFNEPNLNPRYLAISKEIKSVNKSPESINIRQFVKRNGDVLLVELVNCGILKAEDAFTGNVHKELTILTG